jgi:hypothetical protein
VPIRCSYLQPLSTAALAMMASGTGAMELAQSPHPPPAASRGTRASWTGCRSPTASSRSRSGWGPRGCSASRTTPTPRAPARWTRRRGSAAPVRVTQYPETDCYLVSATERQVCHLSLRSPASRERECTAVEAQPREPELRLADAVDGGRAGARSDSATDDENQVANRRQRRLLSRLHRRATVPVRSVSWARLLSERRDAGPPNGHGIYPAFQQAADAP